MDSLDPVIHQPVRLRIMSVLTGVEDGAEADFSFLKQLLELTDGNLGSHLVKLEQSGYVELSKTFVGKKPKTYVQATGKGKDAFRAHVKALRRILESEN